MAHLEDQIQAKKADDIRLTFESAYKHLIDKPRTEGWDAIKEKQRSLGFPPDYPEVFRALIKKITNTFRSKSVSDQCVITAQKLIRNLYYTRSYSRIGENIDVKQLLTRIRTGGHNKATEDEISTHYVVMCWMYDERKVIKHGAFQNAQGNGLSGGLAGINLARAPGLAYEVARIMGPRAGPGLLKDASMDDMFMPFIPIMPTVPVVKAQAPNEGEKVSVRSSAQRIQRQHV